jgi:hypothetical protein
MASTSLPKTRCKALAAPKLSLVDFPDETVHRVACMLKYLAAHPRDNTLPEDENEDFALFLILGDMADALEYAREVAHV